MHSGATGSTVNLQQDGAGLESWPGSFLHWVCMSYSPKAWLLISPSKLPWGMRVFVHFFEIHTVVAYQGNIISAVCVMNAPFTARWSANFAGFVLACLIAILLQSWTYQRRDWSCAEIFPFSDDGYNTALGDAPNLEYCFNAQPYLWPLVFKVHSFKHCCLYSNVPWPAFAAFIDLHLEFNYTQVETVTNLVDDRLTDFI